MISDMAMYTKIQTKNKGHFSDGEKHFSYGEGYFSKEEKNLEKNIIQWRKCFWFEKNDAKQIHNVNILLCLEKDDSLMEKTIFSMEEDISQMEKLVSPRKKVVLVLLPEK